MSDDIPEEPTDVEAEWIEEPDLAAPDRAKPPSIQFLAVWIVTSFLILLLRLGPLWMAGSIRDVYVLMAIPGCLVTGWAVAGAALIVSKWSEGFDWDLEPGEWMLLCLAWMLIPDVAVMLFHLWGPKNVPLWIMQWGPTVGVGMLTLPWLAAEHLQKERSLWGSVFLVIALNLGWLTVLCVLVALKTKMEWKYLTPLFVLLPLVPLLTVASMVQDHERKIRRGWLHWSGIATLVLMAVMTAVAIWVTSNKPQPRIEPPPRQPGFRGMR
jgi:hypothetical protein